MPHVAPVILPEMYKIFIHAEVHVQSGSEFNFLMLVPGGNQTILISREMAKTVNNIIAHA